MKQRITMVVSALLLVMGIASVGQALPPAGTGHDDLFYSDGTFTTVVGERYMGCDGVVSNWGVRTSYVQMDSWDCATGESIFGGCPSGFYYCPDPLTYDCHCF
jgi:hypothetical protein